MNNTTQKGLTLIELLISLIIGLVLINGVILMFMGSIESNRRAQSQATAQEGARLIFNLLGKEFRNTGGYGCGEQLRTFANIIVPAQVPNYLADPGNGFVAFSSEATKSAAGFVDGGDAFTVNGSHAISFSRLGQRHVYSSGSGTDTLTIESSAGTSNPGNNFKIGGRAVLLESNCSTGTLFKLSPDNDGDSLSLKLDNTGTNCQAAITKASVLKRYECGSSGGDYSAATYPPGTGLWNIQDATYFIELDNLTNANAFFRQEYPDNIANDGLRRVLVNYVNNMTFLFGVDTDAVPDNIANQFMTADDVTAMGLLNPWGRVVTVEVQLAIWGDESGEFRFNFNQTFALRN